MQLVIDVRTIPGSRTNPQYNADVLGDELAPCKWSTIAFPASAASAGARMTSRLN